MYALLYVLRYGWYIQGSPSGRGQLDMLGASQVEKRWRSKNCTSSLDCVLHELLRLLLLHASYTYLVPRCDMKFDDVCLFDCCTGREDDVVVRSPVTAH